MYLTGRRYLYLAPVFVCLSSQPPEFPLVHKGDPPQEQKG